ncbi:MAG: hypothetical protein ABI347_03160 [Nitrososphaera sp.]
MQHEELCSSVLALDPSIRFAALVDHLGSLLTTVYRKGLVPLATKEETSRYASQAIYMTGALAGGFNTRVGRMQYVVGKYENLVRATVPIVSAGYDKFYLMLSFDVGTNVIAVIEDKILPFVGENGKSI